MREFISFYILAECVCMFARVYARQYQNRCCFFLSSFLSILFLLSLVLAVIAATTIILIHIHVNINNIVIKGTCTLRLKRST